VVSRSSSASGRSRLRQIPVGAKGSFSLLVQPEHLADRFKDAILPPVFTTPVMIMVMENAALNAIRAYLDDDPGTRAGPDLLGTLSCSDGELDLCHFSLPGNQASNRRRREMAHVDGRAERALAGIDVAKFTRRLE
jgi:fluoroacetyl-CoA thioesterase